MDWPAEEMEKDFSLKTKIYLIDHAGTEFFGIGVLWLLQHIDSLGSIRSAAARMNLSYAKAHRMVKDAEQHSGLKLVERKRGGESREGTSLTPAGRTFISAYQQFQSEVKKQSEEAFVQFKHSIEDLYRP